MKKELTEIRIFLKSSDKPQVIDDVHTPTEPTVPLVSPGAGVTLSDDPHDDSVASADENVPDVPNPDDNDNLN